MNKIMLIEPYEVWREKYSSNTDVVIYRGKCLYYWSEGSGESISKDLSYPSEISIDVDINYIRSKIEWLMPIWYRWIGEVDNYEIFRRTCLLYVVNLAQTLNQIKTKYAIFTTGVSHHVEFSLIEVACQVANVKQIYLYPTPFGKSSRLLPLIQNQSIKDRKLLGLNVSTSNSKKDLVEYRDNHLLGERPKNNESINFKATSFAYAVLQMLKGALKSFIKYIIRWKMAEKKHFIDQCADYSQLTHLKINFRQKKALEYYLSKVVDESDIEPLIDAEAALPVIFAHYQPEASSFPEGGDYSNHLDIVIEIRKMGYRGTILYKEHPGSWIYYSKITGFSRVGLYRSIEYYKQLEALGCVFIKTTFNLSENNAHYLLPITITGSIGVERSLVGLATCCVGEPWFKCAPGIFNLYDTFKEGGLLYNPQNWRFKSDLCVEWFEKSLTSKTINNYSGIGTGIPSSLKEDKEEYITEIDNLVTQLISCPEIKQQEPE